VSGSFTLPMLTDWLLMAQSSLRAARAEIDALNVFPVPDGDTGTNLYLTWEAACAGFRHAGSGEASPPASPPGSQSRSQSAIGDTDFASAAYRIGRDAILGARGNSGVIMSALLRDLCASIAREPQAIAQAMRAGALGAYSVVSAPVEGTILTVARACADKAEEITQRGGELPEIVSEAADAAYQALLQTPELLDQLRNAGVVDAGGRGLVVVLDSLVATITGVAPRRDLSRHFSDGTSRVLVNSETRASASLDFEVMYHLETDSLGANSSEIDVEGTESEGTKSQGTKSLEPLHKLLVAIGESVMIAGIDGTWNVHVHVPAHRIADSINAGLALGAVSKISVTQLGKEAIPSVASHGLLGAQSVDVGTSARRCDPEGPPAPDNSVRSSSSAQRALIVVTHGVGIQTLLSDQGIVCVPTPARQQPSAAELIAAGKSANSAQVVLLPSDKDAHAVADIAAKELRDFGLRASVVPTKSITQSLAAAAVHDPFIDFEQDVVNMTRAASSTHYGAVTQATRNVLTMVGECEAGDVLGLIDGDIAVLGNDFVSVSQELLNKMLAPGAELVTIVLGQECQETDCDRITEWIRSHNPLLDLEVIRGEQPLWPFIFGVE
jgi:uncharacterized protein